MEKEILNKITQLGTLSYDIDRIVFLINDIDEDTLRKEFYNKDSDIYRAYKKGVLLAEFNIDKKLLELAQNGDIKAIQLLEDRKKNREKITKSKKKKKHIDII